MKKAKYRIELSDDAELDFDQSYKYYAKESKQLAQKFYNEVNDSFHKITENPESQPIADFDTRKYVLKKFPFVVYYMIRLCIIRVIAIFHSSRNPEVWKNRNTEK